MTRAMSDFYSGMVLLLSVIVLSCKVRPCYFVRHCPVLQCLVLHFQRPLLKYSQNQRFTTQLESMEGSQCESIGLYLSNNATTLSLEHPASVCKITLSLWTILTDIKRTD